MYYECANVVDLLSETKILMNVNILSTMFEESIFRRSFILQKPVIQKLYKVAITESGDTHVQLGRFTDFHIACIQNQSNRVKQFLSSGTISAPSDLNKPIINGCTILHLTVKSKSDKTASILLDHGADFMLQDKDGKTAFHIAFELNLHFLSYLMVKKFDEQTPNLVDHRGLSVFHILCTCDYIDEIEDFIEQGVDINLQVGNKSTYWAGWAPIHFAINCGQQEVIDVLLEHGADSTVTTELGLNSLDLALDCVNTKKGPSRGVYDRIVDDFLSTDYTGLESSGNRWSLPLHLECSSYNDDPNDLRELLTTHKDHVNKIFKSAVPNKFNGKTPLELALAHGHMQQAKLLIENGADLFRIDDYGGTPLECAFQCEYIRDNESIEAAESIFSIAIESMDKFKPSYFYVACILGLPNAVKNILAKINNQQLKFEYVNCRNDADQTPLHSLLPRREINKIAKEQIVELLLVNGADVNARDYMLQTPLHYTKKAEDLGVMRILLNHGADPNAQNMLGETPLHKMYLDFFERFDQHFNDHASFYKQIVLLLEAGSDVNMIDLQNRTCFTILTKSWLVENTEVVNELSRILLEHVKRLQVIGFCVCEKNEQAYIDLSKKIVSYNEDEFVKKCEEELQSMMSVKIDHRTTLRDILFRSPNDMAYYCENVTLSEVVSSADFARFSIYGYLIKLQIKNGPSRRSLLKNSGKALTLLIGKILPLECIEKILGNLTDKDLRNIILSNSSG
ncbi:hypothetical protein QAD02_001040 [Eretmocerus hayati]|uniref:Uncharacterized protein n=1 Tax=Eretmocerus hayati TaxID=131215 RepID=A0ACC2NFV6_9HYME|nr:hypothetical protein QAD02_001040 [Eretmocerus hayati]